MQNFAFNTSRNITFGAGELARIGDLAAGLAQTKAVIVTDAGMIATGFIAQATEYLRASGLEVAVFADVCLLYTSPSPRDRTRSRMPSSA